MTTLDIFPKTSIVLFHAVCYNDIIADVIHGACPSPPSPAGTADMHDAVARALPYRRDSGRTALRCCAGTLRDGDR